MLEGRKANLRVAEMKDIPNLARSFSDPAFAGEYQQFPVQVPEVQWERRIRDHEMYHHEWVDFVVEDKAGAMVGWAAHYTGAPNFGWTEIGYATLPSHRNRGHASEAVSLLTDYLFLTRDLPRVQAVVDMDNMPSLRVLEKSGFKMEGVLRKALWCRRGSWSDGLMYAITRDDWGALKSIGGEAQAGPVAPPLPPPPPI